MNPDTSDLHAIAERWTHEFIRLLPLTIEWTLADAEIADAQRRHPDAANALYHTFLLLQPTHQRMTIKADFYRAHCHELLERIASGEPTQPATSIEVMLMLSHISTRTPMIPAANGLYLRMWRTAFPDSRLFNGTDGSNYYEATHSSEIDQAERTTRAGLAIPHRTLDNVPRDCTGHHRGTPVDCEFSRKPRRPKPSAQSHARARKTRTKG